MVILIYIVSLIIGIIMLLLAAGKMCGAAELKGHNAKELHIFAWCFFFPIFGYLYVISLPDLKIRELLQDRVNYSQSQQHNNGYDLSEISKLSNDNIESWVCKKCGERNPKTRMTCKKCDTYKNAHL